MHRCSLRITSVWPRRRIHSQQTVSEAVREARERLTRVGGSRTLLDSKASARNDARALVANALRPPLTNSNDVILYSDRKLTEEEASKLALCVELRSNGEPLAYVLRRKEFWSLDFAVSKDTLIPRSDSEVLIETLVDLFDSQTPLRILDIGTGSGCLLLSALSEFPLATGVGIDISQGALTVAEQNARSNKLHQRATFVRRDLKTLPELEEDAEADRVLYQRFDVILCNPPYIPSQELHLVAPDVLKYEPHLALFSDGGPTVASNAIDPEGLRMYRLLHESVGNLFKSSITPPSSPLPATRSCLLMEIGSEDQARAVQALFAKIDNSSCGVNVAPQLRFERFLLDATRKYRGLLFLAP